MCGRGSLPSFAIPATHCCSQNRRTLIPRKLFDEEIHSEESSGGAPDPETQALAGADKESLRRALEELPDIFREALVLREMEGMSYKEIADVTSVSLGTVMSRLARGRTRLRESLSVSLGKEP